MGFFKAVGAIGGVLGGAFTGTVVGGLKALGNGLETGDWQSAGQVWEETIDSHVETGEKIGGECEKIVEAAFVAAGTVLGGHIAKKALEDSNKGHKQA